MNDDEEQRRHVAGAIDLGADAIVTMAYSNGQVEEFLTSKEFRSLQARCFRSRAAREAALEREEVERSQAQVRGVDQELHDRLAGVGDREACPYSLREQMEDLASRLVVGFDGMTASVWKVQEDLTGLLVTVIT